MKPFKILSLDGGGIRGVLSATLLEEVERIVREKKGQELHEYFDLIAGTSTGSILAAGIACQMNAKEMTRLYLQQGQNIFLKSVYEQRKWRKLSQIFGFFGDYVLYPHEYGEQGLSKVLEKELRASPVGKKLGKCPTMAEIKEHTTNQLLILAYDVLSRNTTWFANDDKEEWYYNNELWKICTASASAPTFFPPYKFSYKNSPDVLPHIDGGVAANNPELAAVAHALSMTTEDQTKPEIQQIAVLSVGTGQTTSAYDYEKVKKWGLLDWVSHLPDIFLDPGAENSHYVACRMFMGIRCENRLRLNFELNKQFESKREPGRLRKQLKTPYNEYIEKKTGQKKEINEEIDNPENCRDLIEAAKCYLEYGIIKNYPSKGKDISVREAIEHFIDCH
ncbi:patatin-like phospholipase family protein [Anabaena azotica]|uniref:Patatin-like phospholipase family protein n=1 Tax=Anabaena azotica FACHB-119 TaxID=947527 RepID=A0ABR8DDJ1_9NOST|nr:patatin-like phospholipase family protein [Anabaena azotica]MBD2504201.1 patatin-like phospholipase family protein [Anabaena azotica FACHB-119]